MAESIIFGGRTRDERLKIFRSLCEIAKEVSELGLADTANEVRALARRARRSRP